MLFRSLVDYLKSCRLELTYFTHIHHFFTDQPQHPPCIYRTCLVLATLAHAKRKTFVVAPGRVAAFCLLLRALRNGKADAALDVRSKGGEPIRNRTRASTVPVQTRQMVVEGSGSWVESCLRCPTTTQNDHPLRDLAENKNKKWSGRGRLNTDNLSVYQRLRDRCDTGPGEPPIRSHGELS